MGFIDKLKDKKRIKQTAMLFSSVHPDIMNLLHVAMYSPKSFPDKFNTDLEPSTIYFDLPVLKPDDFVSVPSPEYWPCYYELTAEQRYKYFEFLQNPYSGDHDIGYVFLLFYGLERSLEEEKYQNAFDIIIKLRDVYSHKSFRTYSLDSLISSCIEHQRVEMFCEIMERCELMNDFPISLNLYMLSKKFIEKPFSASDLIVYRKEFGDKNKNLPDDFYSYESIVSQKMIDVFGTSEIDIGDILYKDKEVSLYDICRYQNLSLQHLTVTLPDFRNSSSFFSKCELVLQESRNYYKKPVQRKKNVAPTFNHGDVVLNEKEETFYQKLVFDISNVWKEKELKVWQKNGRLYFDDKYGEIVWVKLTGRKFQMGISDIIIKSANGLEYWDSSISFYDIESVDHAILMIDKIVDITKKRKEYLSKFYENYNKLFKINT